MKPRAPENLTVHTSVSHTWQLTWSNPYPSDNYLYFELFYQVNISNEDDPTDVSGHCRGSATPLGTQTGEDPGPRVGDGEDGWADSNPGDLEFQLLL